MNVHGGAQDEDDASVPERASGAAAHLARTQALIAANAIALVHHLASSRSPPTRPPGAIGFNFSPPSDNGVESI